MSGGGARRSVMWKKVNASTCKCCGSCRVTRGERRKRVVNVPIHCGWDVVYVSGASLCLHVD